jgi:hypothetical protein
VSDRITFRPGPLAAPLAAYCERHGTTPSEAARTAIAKMLGVAPPEMPEGNPFFRKKKRRRK